LLSPVTMRTPVSVAPVKSVATVIPEPRSVVAIARGNDHANYWGWNIEDRSRRRRRVVVIRRGSAVRLNDFGAGIRAQSRPEPECEHRGCYHNKFLPHDRISLPLFGGLNPRIIAKLPKNRRSAWNPISARFAYGRSQRQLRILREQAGHDLLQGTRLPLQIKAAVIDSGYRGTGHGCRYSSCG
jgi:hypothetical protein